MKIQSLFISKYKNIPEKEIFFDTDLTSLIIGQNGLGKSNLLEAITLIFVALSNRDETVSFSNFEGKYFCFVISYKLRGKQIKIIYGIDKTYQIEIDDTTYELKKENEIDIKKIESLYSILIPDYFVTYYSGQNKRLEKILKNFEKGYIDGLSRNKENSKLTSRRNFLFTKHYHAPILLLTLSVFKDFEKDGVKIYEQQILNLFKHLNISTLDSFTLNTSSPYWISNSFREDLKEEDKLEKGYVPYILTTLEDSKKYPHPFWGLKSSLNSFFRALAKSVDIIPYSNEDEISRRKDYMEFINFNDVKINDLQKFIFDEFVSPLELFYTIEALNLLNIVDLENDLKFEIKKQESVDLTFDLLSEGENQLLIVLGIVLITGSDETLFLLDEPDTYLNPRWQREYIQLLEDFNLEDDDSHLIVTTHSPLLVQNIEGEKNYKYDMVLLSRNEKGDVEIDQDEKIFRNWRIDQVLASKYFDLPSTRPVTLDNYIVEKEDIIYNSQLSLEEKEVKIDELLKKYGDLPTGESRNEIQSMLLINEIIKTNSKND